MATNKGRFVKGQHWRKRQAFWERDWLHREYAEKHRSASEIAAEFQVTEVAILFWLRKLGIPRRSISETRAIKKWGSPGAANPMFGRRGVLNPNWKGGLTPFRQQFYASSQWKKFSKAVRSRDKICRLCGSSDKLEIHHIHPFSLAPLLVMDIGNAILLCAKCHRKLKGRELRWASRLSKLIQKGRAG